MEDIEVVKEALAASHKEQARLLEALRAQQDARTREGDAFATGAYAVATDAARYRWLRENWGYLITSMDGDQVEEIFVNRRLRYATPESLDAAIDKARGY